MLKICFVCTGNTCRSVMAERLMKKAIKDGKVENIKVSSRGLRANGENIANNAKIVLKKYKASSANRKSVKLGKIDGQTLYVVMTERMKEYVLSKQVMSMKDLIGVDIADPYGLGVEAYEETAVQIMEAVQKLLEKIIKWREV